jgi:hypothetical protein
VDRLIKCLEIQAKGALLRSLRDSGGNNDGVSVNIGSDAEYYTKTPRLRQ